MNRSPVLSSLFTFHVIWGPLKISAGTFVAFSSTFLFWWLLLRVMPFLMGSVPVSLLWSSNPSTLIALLAVANIRAGPITSLLSSLSVISAWQLCGTTVIFPSEYAICNIFLHLILKHLLRLPSLFPLLLSSFSSGFLEVLLPSDIDWCLTTENQRG